MELIHNKYHIIRYGDFANNGNSKVFYSIFAGILCFDYYQTQNSTDCIIIAVGSTLLWAIVELYLHMSGTRIIAPMFLGPKHNPDMQIILPPAVSALLRGAQEGGVVTTIGLYYGDKMHDISAFLRLHVFIVVVIINVWLRKPINNSIITSKRQINTIGSILFMLSAITYDFVMLWKNPEHLYRQIKMIFVMVYMCSWWTFIAWYKGFRSIEVHVKQNNEMTNKQEYIIKNTNTKDLFLVLGYDVLFEVGIIYLIFYNIFLI